MQFEFYVSSVVVTEMRVLLLPHFALRSSICTTVGLAVATYPRAHVFH